MPTADRRSVRRRTTAWFGRWRPVLPIFLAEFIIWIGFGALLPILPLYMVDAGLDEATLGIVLAAWPAARLVFEPAFGWLADRTRRRPLMILGLLLSGLFEMLPLALTSAAAFLLLRAAAGFAAAMYDPAARAYLIDHTSEDEQGEAFGLFGAAQMGGLIIGPAIGGIAAAVTGDVRVTFVFAGVSALVAAVALWRLVKEGSPRRVHVAVPAVGWAEVPPDAPTVSQRAAGIPAAVARPAGLLNRALVAALIINLACSFATGTYEVVWSIFLRGLGAGIDFITFTFVLFGLPVLVISPIAGRLVDRRGSLAFIVAGTVISSLCGLGYTLVTQPAQTIPISLIESAAIAVLSPALYAVVALASPVDRSGTAQGLFGASGTLGFIVASVAAGFLFHADPHYPFVFFAVVSLFGLVIGLLVGGRRFGRRPPPSLDPGADSRSIGLQRA